MKHLLVLFLLVCCTKPVQQTSPTPQADILIFSFNRPLQLYACLESIERYMTGYAHLTVLYRASERRFEEGYKGVKKDFPNVRFVAQKNDHPKRNFKPNVDKIVFGSPSSYILFGVDDIIVKDRVDLAFCIEQLEKTDAYGFYLRFGRHIDYCYQTGREQSGGAFESLAGGVLSWEITEAKDDWAFANSLDMTLYKKDKIQTAFKQIKYKTPNSLEYNWARDYAPQKARGLCFETSKIVNIPMNIVSRTNNPHMEGWTVEDLLVKFNEGLKMDIGPLYQVQNRSPHFEYIPDFVER